MDLILEINVMSDGLTLKFLFSISSMKWSILSRFLVLLPFKKITIVSNFVHSICLLKRNEIFWEQVKVLVLVAVFWCRPISNCFLTLFSAGSALNNFFPYNSHQIVF